MNGDSSDLDFKNNIVETTTKNNSKEQFSFVNRLRNDPVYRHKFIQSFVLYWLSLCLGWNVSQIGPALPDLQIITRTELDEASYFLTSLSLGFLLGASIAGWVFKKLNTMAVMAVLTGAFGIITVIILWCELYALMIVLFLIRGMARGIVDAGCNIAILDIWGIDNGPYMQALHFIFGIGGIISPIATAPFLSESVIEITYPGNKSFVNNTSTNSSNVTEVDLEARNERTRLYQAFIISAILVLLSCISFIYMICYAAPKISDSEINSPRTSPDVVKSKRLLSTVLFCSSFFCYLVIEKATVFFLPSFTVKHLQWSKSLSSYGATSYWSTFAVGRLAGIWLTKRFRTKRILFVFSTTLLVSSLGIMITSLFKFDTGIWIFIPISGFAQSILFPLLLSWIEEDFFKVSGKLVSLVMFVGSFGTMLTPVCLGYLIDLYTPMWFPYVAVIASVIFIFLHFVLLYLSGNMHRQEIEIFIPKQNSTTDST